MSADADVGRTTLPAEWGELERAVDTLLGANDELRGRLEATDRRVRELEEALQAVTSGELDPSLMAGELEQLRRRNDELRKRMEDARDAVQRVLGRIRFVEEDRG